MTQKQIIKKLEKHGYKVSRCMTSGRLALERTDRYGFLVMCDSYAEAYRIARARHCDPLQVWR